MILKRLTLRSSRNFAWFKQQFRQWNLNGYLCGKLDPISRKPQVPLHHRPFTAWSQSTDSVREYDRREKDTVSDFDEFKSYYALADRLMAAMTPEQLADCLRILALHIADYRLRFGEIPGQDLLGLLGTTEISDDQARIL